MLVRQVPYLRDLGAGMSARRCQVRAGPREASRSALLAASQAARSDTPDRMRVPFVASIARLDGFRSLWQLGHDGRMRTEAPTRSDRFALVKDPSPP
jgi:hypothetical protein